MRRTIHFLFAVLVLLPSLLLTACGGGGTLPSSTSSGGSAATLTQVTLTPNTPPTLAPGGTRQLSASGIFSDGSTAPLSSGLTWTSSAPTVATVSGSGLVTAVAVGTATITVSDGSKSAAVSVTVAAQAATLTSIALSEASNAALNVGSTRQITATGTYSDGGTATLNTGLTWTSGTPATATISSTGLVTAVAAGSTSITASEAGVTSTPLTISVQPVAVTLSTITLSPASVPTIQITGTQQFTATGHYSDGSTAPITTGITWASDNTNYVTISSSGLAYAVAPGVGNITATVGGVTSTPAAVTVAASAVPAAAAQVFYGGQYAANTSFVAFGSSVNSVAVDSTTLCPGSNYGSLKITFPAAGSYTGGAIVDGTGPRNLSSYDSLVLYAKASATLTTDKFGLGNNAVGVSGYEAERPAIPLTTTWQKFVVPIPDPSKLAAPGIAGLFHFADGTNHAGSMWVCDIYYTSTGTAALGTPVPTWNNAGITLAAGATYQIVQTDLSANWTGGSGGALFDNIINYGYFSFTPSNANATVSAAGAITGNNSGSSAVSSAITATLQGHASSNTLPVTVNAPVAVPPPSAAPAVPSTLAGGVVAIFDSSNTLPPVAGTSFPTFGGSAESSFTAGTATVVEYANLSYSGIQLANLTDVSAATHVHFDVYTTGAQQFGFKFVTFTNVGGAPGAESCAGQVILTPTSTPALVAGSWISVDLPLSALTGTDNCTGGPPPTSAQYQGLFQILPLGNTPNGALSGSASFWLDNLYFY